MENHKPFRKTCPWFEFTYRGSSYFISLKSPSFKNDEYGVGFIYDIKNVISFSTTTDQGNYFYIRVFIILIGIVTLFQCFMNVGNL